MEQPESLFHLIEKDKLVGIIESFTKATDITIDINDADGSPVVQHDFFYGFCRSIRSTEEGLKRCIESNARLGFETVEKNQSCTGKCHAGVMLMSVPIMIDGQFHGSITCGQMHLEQPGMAGIEEMLKSTGDLNLDPEHLTRTFQEIQVISMEKCQAAGGLIQYVVNYIVELVYRAKMREELSKEKLKAAEDARLIVELEHTLHQAELRNLQAQIKPHFLFNTLNTITSLVTLGENVKGLNTLFALSNLLRHNFDRPGELVSLGEELQYVENYLLIQKNRFGNRLEVVLEVPGELQDLPVPFLCLQPLVENACIHGLEPKEGLGHLWIRGCRHDSKVEIAVIDDGVGMGTEAGGQGADAGNSDSEIGNISAISDFPEERQGKGGIGLPNVHKRLQLQFGKEFGVKILSGKGLTSVSLLVPAAGKRE